MSSDALKDIVARGANLLGQQTSLRPLDTSSSATYLLVTRTGKKLQISPAAYHLLQLLKAETPAEQIYSKFADASKAPPSEEAFVTFCQKVLSRIEAIESEKAKKGGLTIRFVIFPAKLVQKVATQLSMMFSFVPLLVLAVVSVLALCFFSPPSKTAVTVSTFWLSYLLFLLSVIAHEFGHASACARFGARPSGIGIGLYLIFPVFFSDVSDAWHLKRWQRVIVDLGGLYFQLTVGALYLSLYILSGATAFLNATLFIAGSALLTLNPVLKYDGYWVVADLLGITNLSDQPKRIIQTWGRQFRKLPIKSVPYPRPIRYILFFYTFLSIAVWSAFIFFLLPALWSQIVVFPTLTYDLMHAFEAQNQMYIKETLKQLFDASVLFIVASIMGSGILRSLRTRKVQG